MLRIVQDHNIGMSTSTYSRLFVGLWIFYSPVELKAFSYHIDGVKQELRNPLDPSVMQRKNFETSFSRKWVQKIKNQ